MAIIDIGHTALACHDLEASIAFYSQLGIHESFRLVHDDGSVRLVYLHVGGDRFIELFPGGPEPGTKPVGSFRHICLMTDDIHALVDDLKAKGITIDREVKEGLDHNLQAWITDLDGNPIEFMQISERSPQFATAQGNPVEETDILKPARS
ncbi:MAG TPA: VOC family protein [Thermomicrobiales bacterium]|nr:VOC family protein [Thermomicrobiales bacterium]